MLIRAVTVLFAILILVIIALANSGTGLEWVRFIHEFRGADKLGHFLLFGVLSFLLNLWITRPGIRLFQFPVSRVSLLLAFVVTFEEATQLFLLSRSFSLGDLLADYTGIAILGALGAMVAKKVAPPAAAELRPN